VATLEEALGAPTPLGSDLDAGVDALSRQQVITFTQYIRLILPLDGYAFWVRADMVAGSALYNVAKFNSAGFNQAPKTLVAASTLDAKGSLHYATEVRQEETETYAAERVVFTSEEEINDLSAIAPNMLWIGEFEGKRFAFSSRSSFYRQADLWHYVGFAVYPDMATQIIDNRAGFDSLNVVVSNSLPAWLALNGYNPVYGFGNPSMMLYPSFLVPENILPPFASVHIAPETTRALAMAPSLSPNSTHTQLCAERVRITLWGTRNYNALDFIDCVNQYSLDTGIFGLTNSPVPQDEKRTQSELGTLAMKKTIVFEITYLQHRMNDVARQYITRVIPNFYIDDTSIDNFVPLETELGGYITTEAGDLIGIDQ
jgi:hypothetical protein